ncbi:TrkA family potassium uptake protein [Longispora sp. NPDC051575]|uniref:potassium channel family protein n=1 Tax=Longispora sp. NPDC051575 TaxID=3154943 RepID=UPI0034275D47
MADIRREPVAVIGLGRFGTALALELTRRGTEVLAIDNRPKVVQSLAGQLSHVVAADSTDPEALNQLGLAGYTRAVVAIGTDLEASILTTTLLVDMGVADIWTKAVSRQHGRILERIGAHHVVLPEHDMGERVAHLVYGRALDYVEVDADFAMIKIKPPREAVGTPLGQVKVRSRHGVTIVAVKAAERPGRTAQFIHATGDTVLAYGDEILVVGTIDDVERFANIT